MFPKLTTLTLNSFNTKTITLFLDTLVRIKPFDKFDMNTSGRTSEPFYNISATPVLYVNIPRHKPYGLLCQLPIPKRPWNSISMDFIKQLPPSNGYTSILVVVNQLSKQGIFIPTYDTVTSQDLTGLYVINVFSKHGVPSHVTSNHGSEFVSHFFPSLGTAII